MRVCQFHHSGLNFDLNILYLAGTIIYNSTNTSKVIIYSMKHLKPNNSPDYQPISPHRLNEGEEVSLELKINNHEPDLSLPKSNKEDLIARHASGDFSAHKNHSEPLEPSAGARPMVNLHPDVQNLKKDKDAQKQRHKRQTLKRLKLIRQHRHWHNAKLVVGTVLVFLLIFNSQWFIAQFMYLFNSPTPAPAENIPAQPAKPSTTVPTTQAPAEVVGPQNEIIIPKINVTSPLIFPKTNVESEILLSLRDGVAHYYGTAYPGEVGNTVFFGHSSGDWWETGNYKFIFIILEKLTVGDTYEIHYNSRKYVYQVFETKVVPPNDLSVLDQTNYPSSTLITCTPPGTSWQRFVVRAKQIEPAYNPPTKTASPQSAKSTLATAQQAKLPSASTGIWTQIKNFIGSIFGGSKTPPRPEQYTPVRHLPEVN